MAEPNSRPGTRHALMALLLALTASAVVAAGNAAAVQPPAAGKSFGDTAAYGVRIVSINPDSEVATIQTKNGKHLIVIEVVPGKSIDLIYPGGAKPSKLKSQNTYALSMARYSIVVGDATSEATERAAEEAQKRCQDAADAAARRAKAATRTRDASGKESGPTKSQVMSASADESTSGYRCGVNRPARPTPRYVRIPPRAPADRYLLVISTASDISLDQLNERLRTLTSAGTDIATVLEATASGLVLGFTDKWGGAYIPW